MTWGYVAVGVGTLAVGAYSANQASSSAASGSRSVERSAAAQLAFERERADEEERRWEINRLEEQARYGVLTTEEQSRHEYLKATSQERYEAMDELEKERYADRQGYYEALTAEEKTRYEQAKTEEISRYGAEQARIAAMTDEEKLRYADQIGRVAGLTSEEQARYDALTSEEKLRYARGVQFAQATTTEEQRRYEFLTGEEKSRWTQLQGDERKRYADQLIGREERFAGAEEALQPFIGSAEAAQQQLQVELGLAPGEAGTAYMEAPGYKSALEERTRQVEQEMAGMGAAYSGKRVEEAAKAGSDVQSQYYQNYMSMLTSMASPDTAKTLASLGVGQPQAQGQLGGQGQLYAGQPGAGGLPSPGGLTTGQPGAGQPVVGGSPYISGSGGMPTYMQPYSGAAPSGAPVSGQLPGTGQLTMGQGAGMGNIPSVGGGMVDAATQAAQMRAQGAMAGPAFAQDVMGMGANIYGGYLAGGGGNKPTTQSNYGPYASGYRW